MPRALIIKPSSLGDIVHSIPVAHALAKSGYEVHFAARRAYRPLVEMCPSVARVLDFPSAWGEAGSFLGHLRESEYDAAIDLQGLIRSALATRLSRAKFRLGLPDSREGSGFFYDAVADYPAGTCHAVDRYWSVLKRMGIESGEKYFKMAIPESAIQEARALTGENPYVVLSPTTRRPEKCWPPDRWPKLVASLQTQFDRVVVVGQGSEHLDSHPPQSWQSAPWINLINKTSLPVLCAILARARVCITVDSAPMHLAAALGVPVVALFGPTDPEKVGPYTPTKKILKISSFLADISVEQVLEKVYSS